MEVRWGKISEGEEALELSIAWVIHLFGTIVIKVGREEVRGLNAWVWVVGRSPQAGTKKWEREASLRSKELGFQRGGPEWLWLRSSPREQGWQPCPWALRHVTPAGRGVGGGKGGYRRKNLPGNGHVILYGMKVREAFRVKMRSVGEFTDDRSRIPLNGFGWMERDRSGVKWKEARTVCVCGWPSVT